MTPTNFPEANCVLNPHPEDEGSVESTPALMVQLQGGMFDGAVLTVVAWKPSQEEIQEIIEGGFVYFSCFGKVPPHSINTSLAVKML